MDGFNWDNELVYYESDNKHLIVILLTLKKYVIKKIK